MRGAKRGGIVPSSVPIYWEDALDPVTRAFRPAPAIAKLYRDRGIRPDDDVIAYCQVGMRAAHDLFALRLIGHDKVRNYLGSWDEWGNRDDLPLGAAANGARAFVGAKVWDGRANAPLDGATIVIKDGRVAAVGPAASTPVPSGAERVDVAGRTIVPGFINAHGHVGDTRGLKAAPEFYTEGNLRSQLNLYAQYGITTVASLGGDGPAGFALRDAGRTAPPGGLARLLVAGPVIAATTADEARAEVDRVAAMKPDLIKIRVDDNLGTATKMPREAALAVIDQAHKRGLRVAAHIFYLDDAKALVQRRRRHDRAQRARSAGGCRAHQPAERAQDLRVSDADARGIDLRLRRDARLLLRSVLPSNAPTRKSLEELRDPKRQEAMRTSRAAREYQKALDVAAANLKRLADAGVRIAFGTDTGPPARFQGYFEHRELELMVTKAGLTPLQALRAATSDAAACLQTPGLGTLEAGAPADFLILEKSPFDDIRNTRSLESVWIAGQRVAR